MPESSDRDKPKTCFVITPIGSDNSPIRRHIDGVINEAIIPVLGELGFKVEVSHRMYNPGRITFQIMRHVFEDDLVIANLTNLNPNVMYELALRHAARKPVVHICENETELPFDIHETRTLFYTNDMYGVTELKKSLYEAVKAAMNDMMLDNPIYSAIKESKIIQDISIEDPNNQLGAYVIERMDRLEGLVSKLLNSSVGIQRRHTPSVFGFVSKLAFKFQDLRDGLVKELLLKVQTEFSKIPNTRVEITSSELDIETNTINVTVFIETSYPVSFPMFEEVINRCNTDGFTVESRSVQSVIGDAVH